jgi:hypothetical protein
MRGASVLIAFLSMCTPAVYATECVVNGPRYGLTSDIVNWSMTISSGQSCIRGLRFNNVIIESLELVSSPRTGQVTIHGPGFTYSAKSGYEGEDSFTIALSGTINRLRGSSTIRIIVSVGKPGIGGYPPRSRPPGPIVAPATTPVDNNLPLPDDGSLPPCPTWDWSRGTPPPMQPPELYCPPPPFKPLSQPSGCRCEN